MMGWAGKAMMRFEVHEQILLREISIYIYIHVHKYVPTYIHVYIEVYSISYDMNPTKNISILNILHVQLYI